MLLGAGLRWILSFEARGMWMCDVLSTFERVWNFWFLGGEIKGLGRAVRARTRLDLYRGGDFWYGKLDW